MTREEAIQHFKEQLDIFGGEHAEAIKVAIEALKREPSDDLISRAEAIDALVKETEAEDAYGYTDITNIVHVISNLPSADRPRGYWKHNTTYKSLVFCSECDTPYEVGMTPRNFCPNCGAKMDGERSEE